MPRSRATFELDYFYDPDVIALSPEADRVYLRLVISPTLSQAGTGPWRPSQLLRQMPGLDEATLDTVIDELAAARFAFVDPDTEELFVRPLMRRDGVVKQPNVMIAACREALLVLSPVLRRRIADELARIFHGWFAEVPEGAKASVRNARQKIVEVVHVLAPEAAEELLAAVPEADANPSARTLREPFRNPSRTLRPEPFANPSRTLRPEPFQDPSGTLREPFGPNPSARTPGGGGGGGGRLLSVGGYGGEAPAKTSTTVEPTADPDHDPNPGDEPGPPGNGDPTNPRCPDHSHLPAGEPGPPCMACKRHRVWLEDAPARADAERRRGAERRRAAIAACPDCDEFGWRLGDDDKPVEPATRCTHATDAQATTDAEAGHA